MYIFTYLLLELTGRMNVFYSTDINEKEIILCDQEARHCSRVLRKSVGDEIIILDGEGSIYESEIITISKGKIVLKVINSQLTLRNTALPHIAFGMIKNLGRMEWMMEKLTEIGVLKITPLICNRSERRTLKTVRLEKVLIAAMKQSMRRYLPKLNEPVSVNEFVNSVNSESKIIASYDKDIQELKNLKKIHPGPVIMIGPEGDFTNSELNSAISAGFQRVNLGNSRLRTETAAVVATTILNFN